MTQEDKELLLKDLCARLPYGVKVQCEDYLFTFDKDHMGIGMLYQDFNGNPLESPKIILSGCYYGEDIKPYLFPLSSMTLEQRCKLQNLLPDKCEISLKNQKIIFYDEGNLQLEQLEKVFNFFNMYHIDYRGLISKGLANDATGLNIY